MMWSRKSWFTLLLGLCFSVSVLVCQPLSAVIPDQSAQELQQLKVIISNLSQNLIQRQQQLSLLQANSDSASKQIASLQADLVLSSQQIAEALKLQAKLQDQLAKSTTASDSLKTELQATSALLMQQIKSFLDYEIAVDAKISSLQKTVDGLIVIAIIASVTTFVLGIFTGEKIEKDSK